MKVFIKIIKVIIATQLLFISAASAQTWSQVPSPNPGPDRNYLRGISAVSANEVWAVGNYQVNNFGTTPTEMENLIMKWDSTGWTSHFFPNMGIASTSITDVAAVSSTNVWAVGTCEPGGGGAQAQLLHYDGSNWTGQIVNFPTPGSPWPGSTVFDAIDAISANDIWAVGTKAEPGINPALAYHFNGTTWDTSSVPVLGLYNHLLDVDGISATDVWAVGQYQLSNFGGQFKAMAMHWDGSAWSNVTLPARLDTIISYLTSVKMVASNDVWATGTVLTGGGLLLHWDGTSWTEMPLPGGGGDFAVLAPDDIYMVGANIVHWNGSNWTMVDSLGSFASASLIAATTLPNGEAWAAGVSRDLGMNPDFYTLVYRLSPASPALTVTSSSPQVPIGTPVQLQATTSTSGNYTYLWTSDTPNAFSDPAVANPTVSPTGPTEYAVNVTDPQGRSMQGVVRVGIGPLATPAIVAAPLEVVAAPNPFRNTLSVTIASKQPQQAELTMSNILGQVIEKRRVELQAGENEVLLTGLAANGAEGYYVLSVETPGEFRQVKLLKQ